MTTIAECTDCGEADYESGPEPVVPAQVWADAHGRTCGPVVVAEVTQQERSDMYYDAKFDGRLKERTGDA